MNKTITVLILIILIISGAIGYQLVAQKKDISSIFNTSQSKTEKQEGASTNNNSIQEQNNINSDNSPKLVITDPLNNSKTSSENITMKGKTTPLVPVFINDIETKADSNGNFSVSISLNEGENDIIVMVNDEYGNYSEKQMTIILESVN